MSLQIQYKLRRKQLQMEFKKLDMKFEANKEFMENLSLQFGQTTDGGTKFTCGR